MALLVGNLLVSLIFTDEHTNPAIGAYPVVDYALGWSLTPALSGGAVSDTQPVVEPQNLLVGQRWDSFAFLDWYERIHVFPLEMDLGNIVSQQQRTLTLWNGFFEPHTLNLITATGDTGIVLTIPGPPPIVFAPLQEYTFTFTVSTEGPAVVDAHFIFDFDVDDFDVHVFGVRIVGWAWEINWLDPLLERMEWSTDVMTSYDGTEQRTQLRGAPHGEWEFTFDVADARRREFENIIFGWGARIWALPIWIDVEMMATPINAGATFIELETAGRDFHFDGIGIIVGPDGSYETFGVDTVDADGINTQNPIIETWPQGSRVYPARTARLLDPRATGRFHRNYARGLARFRSVEEIERDALTETTYRDRPVMEREMNWRNSPDIDYERKIETIDHLTGKIVVIDEADLGIPVHKFLFTAMARSDANYLREWLYARRGKARGIWLPTWCDDLILAETITTADTSIEFVACGLTHFAEGKPHRSDIRVQLKSGTVYYRRVSNPAQPEPETETMEINASFPVQIAPADVERISWMHYVRLDTDSIEITWANPYFAECVLTLRGPRNDF